MSLGPTELDGLLSHGVENRLYSLYLPTYLRALIALLVSILGVVGLESLTSGNRRGPRADGMLEPVLGARSRHGSGFVGSEHATASRILR